jgi:glycosyltransferase involved in cell wall biosynthesis
MTNKTVKKILIISYFYPPCNLTASQRIEGWVTYLHECGIYPIVITRNWDIPIHNPEDVLKSSGTSIIKKKFDTHEVHYLPYNASLKDRLFIKLSGTRFQVLTKILTFFQLFLENFTTSVIPYNNLYTYSKKIIQSQSPQMLLISGNPFNQFSFGYRLNKQYSIPWIADYRDDWTTSELLTKKDLVSKMIFKLQQKSEKKWLKSALFFTSISDHYVKKIATFTGRKGYCIYNGHDLFEFPVYKSTTLSFTITYNGSLYTTQPVEVFLAAFKKLIINYKSKLDIKLCFPGLAYDKEQAKRVIKIMKNFESFVIITPRIAKQEVLEIQKHSDLLLMVAHKGIRGVPSSKLFEYIGLRKPILSCPNDNDIIDELIQRTGSGFLAQDETQCYAILQQLIDEKIQNNKLSYLGKEDEIIKLHRSHQTKLLGELINKH